MQEIFSQILSSINHISPLLAGVSTGLLVALLIEFMRYIKSTIARRKSKSDIRASIVEILSLIEENSQLERLDFGKFYYRLLALKSMIDVQSRNLTASEHYVAGSTIAGFIDLADTFRRDIDNLPKKDYYALFVDALKKIKWLDIDE